MEDKEKVIEEIKKISKEADQIDVEAEKEATLSDSQIEAAMEDATNFVNSLKEEVENVEQPTNVINFPSDMEKKDMNVVVDPSTGEEKILGPVEEAVDSINFDDIINSINEDDLYMEEDDPDVTEKNVNDYINSENGTSTELGIQVKEGAVSTEDVKVLLEIVNNKNRGEKFNMYKALPDSIKSIIDKYVAENSDTGFNKVQINTIKNSVAEALIDEFITDIKLDAIKHDFAEDMEKIYAESSKEISEASLDYISERNKQYREGADAIEDPEKRAKLIAILDQIDGARELTTLKEFAKKCKIKSIEIEKPQRSYSAFEDKYKNSNNNIYSINIAKQVLARNMESYNCTARDIDGFFIAFTKQVMNYKPEVAVEHAYMYYVLYYCALLDGDKSDTFKNNVMEVITNLRERNKWV